LKLYVLKEVWMPKLNGALLILAIGFYLSTPAIAAPIPTENANKPSQMTANEKFHYYLKSGYGPKSFALSLMDSSLDQARNDVPEWGQGWDAFG
jgi:hypothetical protein